MAGHLVAGLLHILKQVRVPLKSTRGNIDSPEKAGEKPLRSITEDLEA